MTLETETEDDTSGMQPKTRGVTATAVPPQSTNLLKVR
jgi:hypothetical protein